jgi:hypothetical protein
MTLVTYGLNTIKFLEYLGINTSQLLVSISWNVFREVRSCVSNCTVPSLSRKGYNLIFKKFSYLDESPVIYYYLQNPTIVIFREEVHLSQCIYLYSILTFLPSTCRIFNSSCYVYLRIFGSIITDFYLRCFTYTDHLIEG